MNGKLGQNLRKKRVHYKKKETSLSISRNTNRVQINKIETKMQQKTMKH